MVAVMETIYADAFKRFLTARDEPENLRRLREDAFAVFTEMGFPRVKTEDWKYTNVAPFTGLDWKVGEGQPSGPGPAQNLVQTQGNVYLKQKYPQLDYIQSAKIE